MCTPILAEGGSSLSLASFPLILCRDAEESASWRKTLPDSVFVGLPISGGQISGTHRWLSAIEQHPEQCWSRSWGIEGFLHGSRLGRKTPCLLDPKQVSKAREEVGGWGCDHVGHVARWGSENIEWAWLRVSVTFGWTEPWRQGEPEELFTSH